MPSRLVLGLDLGPNSAGWALIEESVDADGSTNPVRLVDAGARIFPEGVEANRNQSRNTARRDARAIRRQHDRRTRRREGLLRHLTAAGLMPKEADALREILAINPYSLRARALDQKLEPFELGRALYHLGQRRGFLSNRKAERGSEKKKENEGVAAAISTLDKNIAESGARTLGEYLSRLDPALERIRKRYTSRAMYQHEFDAIWNAQSPHHPDLLTDDLRRRFHQIIFNQRPLKVQKGLVGECELEPGRKRSPRGTWYAQQFRLIQDVCHLEFPDAATGEVRKLNDDERAKLIAALQRKKSMPFPAIRKTLDLLEAQKFNFETADHRKELKGNATEALLRSVLKSDYDRLSDDRRDEVVRDLLYLDSEDVIRRHAVERCGLDADTAAELASKELQPGYVHLSEKALRRMIPHLERGLPYMTALEAAGYERPDQRRIESRDRLLTEDMPKLRNPIVSVALNQTRRLVNAIAAAYGKPARIRVEMARDLKVSLGKRAEILKENKKNREENEAADQLITEQFRVANPTRDDRVRLRLWIEQAQTCPYTGRTIPNNSVFSPEWDVDHILPWPRSGDDSYMNKVLCDAAANRQKGNRTPHEAWHGDQPRWDDILLRIKSLPWSKRRKFDVKEIDTDAFISRQLNDTRYIARAARDYLATLTGKYTVEVGKGAATAALRRRWGLNRILSDSGEKTRADHRHHAVDAVVIALTTPTVIKRMSALSSAGRRPDEAGFPPPWENFRHDVKQRIDAIRVSHRVIRGIVGALHDETNYGILGTTDEKGMSMYAVRKPLERITQSELSKIADDRVRALVIDHLRRNGADPDAKNAEKTAEWKQAMTPPSFPTLANRAGAPVPIKKVRLHIPSKSMFALKNRQGVEYRAVESGSNHHIAIFEVAGRNGKKEWKAEVVPMFHAARRARAGEPIIRRDESDGRRFIMSLSKNEILRMNLGGIEGLWRVQKFDINGRVTVRPHNDARKSDDRSFEKSPSVSQLQKAASVKVTIDLLGRVHDAND
jgi:CRISPR-associated endonuclease Csn1